MAEFSFAEYQSLFHKPLRIVYATTWIMHIPFAFLLMEILRPRITVELGVHSGNSFSAFCQAVRLLNTKTSCCGVDTFKGDPHSGFYDESIYADLNNYIKENYGDFAQLMRMTFDEALEYFSDKTIDLLHIDGYHAYERVKHDFESWLPKMSDRGVVLLHDTQVRRDQFGAWRLWEEISSLYPSCEFRFGYGLGVLLVGENIPQELSQFVEKARGNVFIEQLLVALGSNIELSSINKGQDLRIKSLAASLEEKAARVTELNGTLQANEAQIGELASVVAAKDNQIGELASVVAAKDNQIGELASVVTAKDNQMDQIKHSIGMQLISRYQRLAMKLFPPSTKRGALYQRALSRVRTILNEGWRSSFRKRKTP